MENAEWYPCPRCAEGWAYECRLGGIQFPRVPPRVRGCACIIVQVLDLWGNAKRDPCPRCAEGWVLECTLGGIRFPSVTLRVRSCVLSGPMCMFCKRLHVE